MSDHPVTRKGFERKAVRLESSGICITEQSHKDLCDINEIMAQWKATGVLVHEREVEPRYGDFANAVDYQTACNRVLEAQASFDALPSAIRARMRNDPAELMAFMADEENYQEAVQLGLLPPAPASTEKAEAPAESGEKPPEEEGAKAPKSSEKTQA